MGRSGYGSDDEQPSRKRSKHSTSQPQAFEHVQLDKEKEELREQLAKAKTQLAGQSVKIDFLTDKVKSVAERSKTRGNLLISLMAAVNKRDAAKRTMEIAKAELEAAEQALVQAIEHVTQVMASEAAPAPAAAPAAPPAEPHGAQAAQQGQGPESRTTENQPAAAVRPSVTLPQTLRVPL